MEKLIAVAAPSLSRNFCLAFHSELKKHVRPGQSILECSTSQQDETEYFRTQLLGLLAARPAPSALIGICITPGPETLRAFAAARVPIVLIDSEAPGASTIASDNAAGAHTATEHLVRSGRRSIAAVVGPYETGSTFVSRERLRGFEAALTENGRPLDRRHVFTAPEWSRKNGADAMNRILDLRPKFDAVFWGAGDICCVGGLAVALERKVKIPEDLAVVGFDDNPLAAISTPPLTTMRQRVDLMAREAWRLATEVGADLLVKPQKALFEPELVRRQSA